MNKSIFDAAMRRAKENAYEFRPLTDNEESALAEYRKNWKPMPPEALGFDINALHRHAHVRLRRWTARGFGPVEIGLVGMDFLTTRGDELYLCFMPHSNAHGIQGCLQYPIGHLDQVEVIGESNLVEPEDGLKSWYDRNEEFFKTWSSYPVVDMEGGSDPIFMGEYLKDRNEKVSEFTWRLAAHQSNKVTAAYQALWDAVYRPIDNPAMLGEDREIAMLRLAAIIEEVGFGWFPSNEGVEYIKAIIAETESNKHGQNN